MRVVMLPEGPNCTRALSVQTAAVAAVLLRGCAHGPSAMLCERTAMRRNHTGTPQLSSSHPCGQKLLGCRYVGSGWGHANPRVTLQAGCPQP